MKNKLIILGVLLLVMNVNSYTWELGDLDYMCTDALVEYDTYFINEVDNQGWLFIALPYAGKYEFSITNPIGSTIDIYESDKDGNLIYLSRDDIPFTRNFTTQKPFIKIQVGGYSSGINKNSTLELLEVDYTYVDFSENQNNNYPMICPYSGGCNIQQYVHSSTATVMTNGVFGVEYGYTNNAGFDLSDYCNIIDNDNEVVEIASGIYNMDNLSESMTIVQYVQLNNYVFNYLVFPVDVLPVELHYNNNYTFSVMVEEDSYWQWDETNSVSWYWDGYNIYPYQEASKNINLEVMNNEGYDVEPGFHQLKAQAYFSCDIQREIIWDIRISGKGDNNYTPSCTLWGSSRDIEDFSFIQGVIINLYQNDIYIDSDITDYEGWYEFHNLEYGKNYTIYATKDNYISYSNNITMNQEYKLHNFYMTSLDTKYNIKYYYKDTDSYENINNFSIIFQNLGLGTYLEIINNSLITQYGCNYVLQDNWIEINNISEGTYECTHGAYLYYDYIDSSYVDENSGFWTIYLQNISLMKTQNVTGYVSYNNTFLSNILVKLLKSPEYNIYDSISTYENGFYNFTDIPNGNYIIEVDNPMYEIFLYGAFVLNTNKEINISLSQITNLCTLTGYTVMCDSQSFKIPNVQLDFYDSDNFQFTQIYSDNDGKFVKSFPCDSYKINLTKIGYRQQGTPEVALFRNQEIYFCMNKDEGYNILYIHVEDDNTEWIEGAEVIIKKNNIIIGKDLTNIYGNIFFITDNGDYVINVKKLNYSETTKNINIFNNDENITIVLNPSGDLEDILNDLNIPKTEIGVWNWLNNHVWTLLFLILLLFLIVIILNLLLEGKTKIKQIRK